MRSVVDASRGIVTIEITGVLSRSELAAMQQKAREILQREGSQSLLIRAEGFEEWEDLMLTFVAKGLRQFEIEYFQPAQVADARAWLARDSDR